MTTTAQASFIRSLLGQKIVPTHLAEMPWTTLDTAGASWFIKSLLALPNKGQAQAVRPTEPRQNQRFTDDNIGQTFILGNPVEATQAVETVQAMEPVQVIESVRREPAKEGYYLYEDQYYHVVLSKYGRPYAKVLVDDADRKHGTWEYVRGMVFTLTQEHKVDRIIAQRFGREHGYCMICGRTLTDPDSVARGIGPICIERL